MGQWAKDTLAESESDSRKLSEESVLEEQVVTTLPAGNEHQGCMRRNVLPASEPNALFVTLNLPYAELHQTQIQDTAGNTVFGLF